MIKRVFDFCVAVFLFLLLIPVMVVIALLVKLSIGSPVLFCQIRPGLKEKKFELKKFRTMRLPSNQQKTRLIESDAERLTKFGLILRSTSLDELPSLWNVIVGEMSLVGPRPLLTSYLDRYTDQQARRHNVRPGITGLTQISGRNSLCWEDKLKLDVWYVENRSFWLDLKILWTTLVKVVIREGVTAAGNATAAEFSPQKKSLGRNKESEV